MVQKASSFNHLNGFYRPGLSFPEQLLATTVGREEILQEILTALSSQGFEEEKQNFVIMGPPGVGKTHFIRILGKILQDAEQFKSLYTVLQFPEENHRILSFADLLLGILEILGNITGDGKWTELYNTMIEEMNDTILIDSVMPELEHFCSASGKTLLILLENIDIFFKGQLRDNKNIKAFQKFITKSSYVTFVGTSRHNLIKTEQLRRSPYNLFDIKFLDVLTQNQTIELIKKYLEWDRRSDLLQSFEDLIPRINALYEMSGGNPRLSLILYELISKESSWDVKRQIERLLDQTTPFFRERMKALEPQERALLETIALIKIDQKTATNIAKNMRQSLQQTSSHLNKLLKANYLFVTDHPNDGRSKIYRIREGFFGLWLAIGHSREQNTILPRLVEFFEQWYSEKPVREKKRQQIWNLLHSIDEGEDRNEIANQRQLLKYLSDIGSEEERIKSKLEFAHYLVTSGSQQESTGLLQEIREISSEPVEYVQWMLRNLEAWGTHPVDPLILQQMEDIFLCWRLQNTEETENLAQTALKLSNSFLLKGDYELVDSFIYDIMRFTEGYQWKIRLLERIAISKERLKLWHEALEVWKEVFDIAKNAGDLRVQGTTLNNISQIHQDLNEFDTALDYLRKALKIQAKINDFDGQGTTLNNISTIHFERGYYEKALERLEQALEITRMSHNLSIESITLSNISLIYQARNDHERALEFLELALDRMQRTGNRNAECITLNNISQIYLDLEAFEEADYCVNSALSIATEDNNRQNITLSLYNRGKVNWQSGKRKNATIDWAAAYQYASDEQYGEILSKLNDLAISLEKNGNQFWQRMTNEASEPEFNEFFLES